MYKQCAIFCLVLMLGSYTHARVLKLDFGTPDSPVESGFTQVTADSVMWVDSDGLEHVDMPVPRVPFPPVIYTTDLRQDSIQSRGAATLRLTLPKGDYRVWMMIGTGERGYSQVWNLTVRNLTSGSQVTSTFFGGYTARTLELDAQTNAQGVLELEFQTESRWSINAVVIVPRDEWEQVYQEVIVPLERSIELLPDDVLERWEHTPYIETTPELAYTSKEEAQGYVLYQLPWVTPVWPNTNPYREQTQVDLHTYISPDEYAPITFTILPLRSLGALSIDVADLKSDMGEVLSAENVEVRYVQYCIVRSNYKTFGAYYRAPDLLPRFDSPQALTPHENFRTWLIVHAPQGTSPGVYRGMVELKIDDTEIKQLPLTVNVLPITLMKNEDVTYSTYYRHPSRYQADAPDDFSREWWNRKIESDMKSMAAYGYNGFRPDINVNIGDDGLPIVDLSNVASQLSVAKSYGMDIDRPIMVDLRQAVKAPYRRYTGKEIELHYFNIEVPPKRFFEEVGQLVAKVEEERKRLGLPEFLYSLADEPKLTDEAVGYVKGMYTAAKEVPGVRTYLTTGGVGVKDLYVKMEGNVDVWSVQQIQLEKTLPREMLAEQGVELWCYPNAVAGENDHTPVAGARMMYGFAGWKYNCPGMIPWIFESWGGDPYNNLDALQMDFFNRTTDEGELLPCVLYEAYREGIDDHRYITTLEYWIHKALDGGHHEQAKAAQATLDMIRNDIPVREIYQYDVGWSDASFDQYRLLVIREILQLQALSD